jgi:hypothetical protein
VAENEILDEVVCRSHKVVDSDGRVRAFLGELPEAHSEGATFVIELRDTAGRARASLMLTPDGPLLLFDQNGNNLIELGVHDWTESTSHRGAYFVGSDTTGEAVVGWRVEADGSVDRVG